MKTVFACAFLILYTLPAAAQSIEKCREIKADKARLACFDAATAPVAVPAPPSLAQASAQQRSAYANSLEKVFLKTGVDATVMSTEKKDGPAAPGSAKEYPRIIIWAYMGKPFVYQMISQTEVLKTAQSLGFKVVDFWDKGAGGHWFYDVSGTEVPRCDTNRGLCRD